MDLRSTSVLAGNSIGHWTASLQEQTSAWAGFPCLRGTTDSHSHYLTVVESHLNMKHGVKQLMATYG